MRPSFTGRGAAHSVLIALVALTLGGCMGMTVDTQVGGNPLFVRATDRILAPLTRFCLPGAGGADASVRASQEVNRFEGGRREARASVDRELNCYPAVNWGRPGSSKKPAGKQPVIQF